MFDPLAMENCTLNAAVSDDSRMSSSSGRIGEKLARGSIAPNTPAPSAMMARM